MEVGLLLEKSDSRGFAVGGALIVLLLGAWAFGIFATPTDAAQGEVYRIIYLHVPAAISAFGAAYVLLIASVISIWKKSENSGYWGKASAEFGLGLTVITLATGSIWGYPTWGVWWTWDARITTTFLLALLFGGYILLYDSMPQGSRRDRACGVLGILIAVDVPIIYKSVTWWRTLHQPPSILREGGSTMEPEMLRALGFSFVALLLFSLWGIWVRANNLKLARAIELESYKSFKE